MLGIATKHSRLAHLPFPGPQPSKLPHNIFLILASFKSTMKNQKKDFLEIFNLSKTNLLSSLFQAFPMPDKLAVVPFERVVPQGLK